MTQLKKCFYLLIPIAVGIAITSCNSTSDAGLTPGQTAYKPPVSQPLVLSKPQKIDWDGAKAVAVHPLVKHFDLDKLPAQSYDTVGFKPFKYPVEETHLDINTLPEKDLDIDKLPSRPLKFTTEKLPPPRLIHAGPPHLKDLNLSLFELGEPQGLQGQAIVCLFTDHDGFLWIATDKGLYRYDGGNLLLYLPGPWSYPDYIFSMLQDASGRIWMGTLGSGLEVLDPKAGTLKRTNRSLGLSADNTGRLLQDVQQRIWLTTNSARGVNIIDPKTETVQWLDKAHGLADTTAGTVVQDKYNRIWIASNSGINIIDPGKKKIKQLNRSNGLRSDSVDNLLFDRAGHLWLPFKGGVMCVVDLQKNRIQTIKEAQTPKAGIIALLQDSRGKIWLGDIDHNGVTIIDPEKHLYKTLKTPDGLKGDKIINITQDKQGQVWIGTVMGLSMISDNKAVIERIGKGQVNLMAEDKHGLIWNDLLNNGIDISDRGNKTTRHLGARQGLSSDTTSHLLTTKDRIFISTNSGLDIIDPAQKTLTLLGKKQGLDSKIIFAAVPDKAGRIWMVENSGFSVYDPKTNTVKHLGKALGFTDAFVTSPGIGTDGKIWFYLSTGGVAFIDPQTMTIQYLMNKVPVLKGVAGKSFVPGKKGNMWIGTDKGIYIADLKNKTLTEFSIAQGLIDDRIATIVAGDKQTYACSVHGVTVITPPAEGIITNKKWGVLSFGNEYGLYKINPFYYSTDAMSADGHLLWGDYGVSVLDLTKKDTAIPPTFILGMNIMDQSANFTGRVRTESKGKEWDGVSGPFNLPVNLELPHDQNYMQFFYGTLNFKQRDTTWYRYRLVGKDTGWSDKTTLENSRNYFSLAPGKYTFEVTSKSLDNGWSKPASISFVITPPWWQTWWAYLIYVFLFGGTIWGFVTYRSMQLIREKRVLELKVQQRTEEVMQQKEEIEAQRDDLEKAFTELKSAQTQLFQSEKMASLGELTAGIAHEIQNPLNFVNNFSEVNKDLLAELKEEIEKGNLDEVKEIADNVIANEEKISHHGKRADSIVKSMLEHSRNTSGQKEPADINVIADEYLRLSYHGLRAKNKSFNADLTTHFDPELPKINVVQQDIGRVLLNLFNNAFYAVNERKKKACHDYQPTVEVTTFFLPLQGVGGLKVRDNGIGIPDNVKEKIMQPFFTTKPTGEGTGLGLSLTYDMVVKGHGGKIEVNTKEGEFTEFIVTLPL